MKIATFILLTMLAITTVANDSYDAAIGLIKQKKYEPAANLLAIALKDEDSPRVRYALGFCAEKTGKKEQAIEHYRTAFVQNQNTGKGADWATKAVKRLASFNPQVAKVLETAGEYDALAAKTDSIFYRNTANLLYVRALKAENFKADSDKGGASAAKLRINSIAYRKLTNEALFFYSFERHSVFNRMTNMVVRDDSRHRYEGKCKNTEQVEGRIGQAMRFSGDSEIDMGDVFNEVGLPVTIAYWAKPEKQRTCWILRTDQWDRRLYSGFISQYYRDRRYVASWGTARGGDGPPYRRSLASGLDAPFGEWSHIVIAMEKDRSFRCYVNGKSVPVKPNGGAKKVRHTKAHCKIGENFIGDIDEIGMWKRALTPEEAKVLYAAGN